MAKIDSYIKTEIEAKVKAILKLIKDGELDMDGTPEEILKTEPLAEFVKICEDRLQVEVGTIKSLHSDEKRQMHAIFESECHNKIQAPLDFINNQKREVEEQLRAKERELKTLEETASGYENQISAYQNAIRELAQKNLDQEDELGKLKKELTARTKDCSAIQRKLNTAEKDASGDKAKVENLEKDLLSLKTTKEELELNCEKLGEEREKLIKEHAQTLKFFHDENNELANQVMDLQRTLKEQEDAHQKLNKEYKQVDSKFNECKVNLEVANRKIEEKEEELRESIASKDQIVTDLEHQVEDLKRDLGEKRDEIRTLLENVRNHEENLRLSNQKLRVTEQLLSEKEESFRKAKEELQQVLRELEDRNATLVAKITANNKAFHETITDIKVCVNSVNIGIDTLSKKCSNDCNNYENSIANISRELQDVKEYVSEMNREKGKLQKDKMLLWEELQGKKEEELTLKEEIEKLQAKGRKAEEELRQFQRELEDRNATEVCVDSVKIGIDTVSKKFSDDCNNYDIEKSIANISRELQDVKEHVSEVNSEKEKLQNDNRLLLEELRGKEEHELTLNEKIEKLEIECKNMEAIRKLSLKIVDLTEIPSKYGSNC
ncbi:unnamed protein product [Trifolium pratense]|uniref:Uncharacterized protein n=1 Tax=Trifolium pratense TaxID=57577 RepID=A0ACB0M784_TRIPR|nr:unnamed protein product [Trifolium pratense]